MTQVSPRESQLRSCPSTSVVKRHDGSIEVLWAILAVLWGTCLRIKTDQRRLELRVGMGQISEWVV